MQITTVDNQFITTNCIGCSLAKGEIKPYGGIIYESKYFIVVSDIEVPIPGFIIISAKRHISSILDFSKEELNDFNNLLIQTRKAISQALPNIKISLIQKEIRSHFHFWFMPKLSWMEQFGDKLSGISEILEYSKKNLKTESNLKEILKINNQIKNYFSKL